MAKRKLEKSLVGIAGVYYVAAELTRRGYIALVTTRNTRAYDLVIFKQNHRIVLPIQVKAKSSGGIRIVKIENINELSKELRSKVTCPYVLVDLEKKSPDFYILSRNQMRRLIKLDWHTWVHDHKHRREVRSKDVQIIFQLPKTMHRLQSYKSAWKNLHIS